MSEEKEEELPGVTLWWRSSKTMGGAKPGEQNIRVELHTVVHDEALWKEVEKQLQEGFRIFTIEDFKGALINAYKHEASKLEKTVDKHHHENARLVRENELLRERLKYYDTLFENFSSKLQNR